MPSACVVVHQPFGVHIVARASALDYVRGYCEWSAAESYERNVSWKRAARQPYGFVNVIERFDRFDLSKTVNVRARAYGVVNDWAFAFAEL